MIRDFLSGLSAYGKALSFSTRHRLWGYWLLPALLGSVVGILMIGIAWQSGSMLSSTLVGWYPFDWGADFITGAAPWIARAVSLILGVLIFKHVLLVVVSPFMSMLSERIESILDSEPEPVRFSWRRAVSEMMRGLRLALRNLWRELILVLLLTVLSFIPPLTLVTAPLIFFVQAYYAGFGNLDFTLERRYSLSSSVQVVRQHRGSAIANGIVFLLLIASVIGILVAPTWSTIAGVLEVRRFEEDPRYS